MSPTDPDRYIPDLPEEIWLYILRLATNEDNSFLHSIADPPDLVDDRHSPRSENLPLYYFSTTPVLVSVFRRTTR